MLLKISSLLLIGFLLGGATAYKLIKPKLVNNTVTVTDVQTKIVKVTEPNGRIIETTVSVNHVEAATAQAQSKYALGLFRQYDFRNQKDIYELSIYRHVFSGFHVGFSANTANQIGIGILKTF